MEKAEVSPGFSTFYGVTGLLSWRVRVDAGHSSVRRAPIRVYPDHGTRPGKGRQCPARALNAAHATKTTHTGDPP